ncbi:hypothetical protein LINGRAHAP2_LOCUS23466, partial [Linum grandiflorum]
GLQVSESPPYFRGFWFCYLFLTPSPTDRDRLCLWYRRWRVDLGGGDRERRRQECELVRNQVPFSLHIAWMMVLQT